MTSPDQLDADLYDDPNREGEANCEGGAWGEPERPEGDVTVTVYRPLPGVMDPVFLTVALVAGDAPWATCHCGKVVVGPPHPEYFLPCCGVAETTLPWNDGSYWVLDAVDEDGNDVLLTPSEYMDALQTATDCPTYIE
jgi:hypothetical protein